MRHEKKTWPEYFQKILEGKKTFDLRLADWDCKEGDILVLKEWDPKTGKYTGRIIEKEITCIVRTKELDFFSKDDAEKYGYQVIAFK